VPQPAASHQYEDVYRAYVALYPALKANFAQLAQVDAHTERVG
jgi:hypothetical protein